MHQEKHQEHLGNDIPHAKYFSQCNESIRRCQFPERVSGPAVSMPPCTTVHVW
jgi:hypothetical protein